MTASELLADGRLTEAITEQAKYVDLDPSPAARLFLFELLVLADRTTDAIHQLAALNEQDIPRWPATRRRFTDLIRAIHKRSHLRRRPQFLLDPPPHAQRRWNAARAVEVGDPDRGVKWVDRADAATPEARGFVDGREFQGFRDGDERFASVFEVYVGSQYVWVPFEQVRALVIPAAAGVVDVVYRPTELRLTDGRNIEVVLPMVYPLSAESGDEFALGEAVDWTTEDLGPVCAFGAKLYFVGEEELPLSQIKMLEFR